MNGFRKKHSIALMLCLPELCIPGGKPGPFSVNVLFIVNPIEKKYLAMIQWGGGLERGRHFFPFILIYLCHIRSISCVYKVNTHHLLLSIWSLSATKVSNSGEVKKSIICPNLEDFISLFSCLASSAHRVSKKSSIAAPNSGCFSRYDWYCCSFLNCK